MSAPVLVALSLVAAASAPAGRPGPADADLLRLVIAETALAQARRPDAEWSEAQRDCAGLVRHAYRTAYGRLRPARLREGLWLDGSGRPVAFADAATLLARSFRPLGRDAATRRLLATGDVAAFRRADGEAGEPVHHLMLVVRAGGARAGEALVVYHPGLPGAAVRTGALEALVRDAPLEWRPVPQNPAFAGFFRFAEWMP